MSCELFVSYEVMFLLRAIWDSVSHPMLMQHGGWECICQIYDKSISYTIVCAGVCKVSHSLSPQRYHGLLGGFWWNNSSSLCSKFGITIFVIKCFISLAMNSLRNTSHSCPAYSLQGYSGVIQIITAYPCKARWRGRRQVPCACGAQQNRILVHRTRDEQLNADLG